jgi:hypothetical protein
VSVLENAPHGVCVRAAVAAAAAAAAAAASCYLFDGVAVSLRKAGLLRKAETRCFDAGNFTPPNRAYRNSTLGDAWNCWVAWCNASNASAETSLWRESELG